VQNPKVPGHLLKKKKSSEGALFSAWAPLGAPSGRQRDA
jgi:hypothetical protein